MATPYQFQCDYIAGCTPQIMDALLRHNLTEVPGYFRMGQPDILKGYHLT